MKSVDKYLSRRYNHKTYNCAHFVAEVWKDLTGIDIAPIISGLLKPRAERTYDEEMRKQFVRIDRPKDPCIVLLRAPGLESHVGVYLRRRVLHLNINGATFQPLELATLFYTSVRYYECR